MIWKPYKIEAMQSVQRVFLEWKNTPYMRDQLCKKVACDCVTFAYGFYCDLFKVAYTYISLPSLPKFSPNKITNSLVTKKLIEIFKRRFFMKKCGNKFVQSGDLIAARTRKGLGHVFIVGVEENTVYHCDYDIGVVQSGFEEIGLKPLILRSTMRELWV